MWLWLAFSVSLVIQVYFYLIIFKKYAYFTGFTRQGRSDLEIESEPAVSIVICAKNEAKHLEQNLESIANQNYSNFEIILVDDASDDDTLLIFNSFKKKYFTSSQPIHVLSIPKEDSQGKKKALSLGIQQALNDFILLTDADCRPSSRNWIKTMIDSFDSDRQMILGYGPYKKQNGSFLNKMIRYETLLTAIQYFSYALYGKPYMGVGRNLAYKKHLFEANNGFEGHLNVKSGDDDLFVNQVGTATNTSICDHPDSFMYSAPKGSLKTWVRQKRRHVSTSGHYQSSLQLMLGAFYLSQIGFYVFGTILLVWGSFPLMTGFMIIARFSFYYLILSKSAKKLEEKDLIRLAPLYEISVIFIQLYIFIANHISPPRHW